MKIKVRWEAEDGYVGKSRPQETIIETDDLMDQEEWDRKTSSLKSRLAFLITELDS